MMPPKENPGAIAVAHRVEVTKLASKNDHRHDTGTALDLQVCRVLSRYAVSLPVAVAVAELAFSSERCA